MSGEDTFGARAVELLDTTLARRPEKDDASLADAVTAICSYRRDMIGGREADDRSVDEARALATLNGVLSLVLAAQFPLGDIRWNELEGARDALAKLVRRALPN